MHGLVKSINSRLTGIGKPILETPPAAYFSINKPTFRLEDMYLDMLISRWISAMTRAHRRHVTHSTKDTRASFYGDNKYNDREAALKFWFDVNNTKAYPPPTNNRNKITSVFSDLISEMLSNNIVGYNPRTNSVHYRRLFEGDDDDNLLCYRKHDTIGQYVTDFKAGNCCSGDLRRYVEGGNSFNGSYDYSFMSDFIEVDFNPHLKLSDGDESIVNRNSQQAKITYSKIVNTMENKIECSKEHNSNGQPIWDFNKHPFLYEVSVIDGFSHMDNASLRNLPYGHLRKILGTYSRISILVFDREKDGEYDGDIVIDLRKNEDQRTKYTYYELQIAKCIVQAYAYGWHQYKRRIDGIIVFPSIHQLMTKRHYIPNRIHDVGKGILDNSFHQFLSSKFMTDNVSGFFDTLSHNQKKNYFEEFYFEKYNESSKQHCTRLLSTILNLNHILPVKTELNNTTDQDSTSENNIPDENKKYSIKKCNHIRPKGACDEIMHDLLYHIIMGHESLTPSDAEALFGWKDHYPSTAIIGNPNSFKRYFVLSRAYNWAKQGDHVLFVLFGKEEIDLRKQMVCPALRNKIDCISKVKEHATELEKCTHCCRNIHFLGIRSGCITAEEFFSTLQEQISIYCDVDSTYKVELKRLHVIIDDFQRIDFCFPFIKESSLFTCALMEICRSHNVDLTILCDKSSERRKEVCALSDNVLCVERDSENVSECRLYIERMIENPCPSSIIRYDISDIYHLFKCDNCIKLNDIAKISYSFIGSMKEYWRQTRNVITNPKHSRFDDSHTEY